MDGWDARWLAGILAEQFDFERRGRATAAGKSVSGFGFGFGLGFSMKRERRREGREEMGNLREKQRDRSKF